jgi:hypothetical protein
MLEGSLEINQSILESLEKCESRRPQACEAVGGFVHWLSHLEWPALCHLGECSVLGLGVVTDECSSRSQPEFRTHFMERRI